MVEERKYYTEWEEYELVPLGGLWAYAIGVVKDQSGNRKLRIAKGKIKGKVFKEEGKIKYTLDNDKNPISQINKFNIKSREEWEKIKPVVEKFLDKGI